MPEASPSPLLGNYMAIPSLAVITAVRPEDIVVLDAIQCIRRLREMMDGSEPGASAGSA